MATHSRRPTIPELYNPVSNSWTVLASAERAQAEYPWMFLLPSGDLFDAGPAHPFYPPPPGTTESRILNAATWTWGLSVADPVWPVPSPTPPGPHGSAVMYEPGKVMKCGGQNVAVSTTFVVDLTTIGPNPKWIAAGNMNYARRNHNLVLLPDGKVLAVGGNARFNTFPPPMGEPQGEVVPVFHAEIFDPASGKWTVQPPSDASQLRMYHSSAALLCDGRVVSAGGDLFATAQIFRPPYITSEAPRPSILTAPAVMHYAGINTITYADNGAKAPSKACLIRLAAVTHGFDHDQRYVPLTISSFGEGFLNVQAPANGNIAPPGYYMLWILSEYALNEFAPCTVAAYVQVGP